MAIHDIPLAQLFAFNACDAWANGLEPAGPTYADLEMHRSLAAIMAAKS